jgi:hypothetical protein
VVAIGTSDSGVSTTRRAALKPAQGLVEEPDHIALQPVNKARVILAMLTCAVETGRIGREFGFAAGSRRKRNGSALRVGSKLDALISEVGVFSKFLTTIPTNLRFGPH